MWTTGEWVKVILIAVIWGGGVMGLVALGRRRARRRPVLFGAEIVAFALMGAAFAVGLVFLRATFSWTRSGTGLGLFIAGFALLRITKSKWASQKME